MRFQVQSQVETKTLGGYRGLAGKSYLVHVAGGGGRYPVECIGSPSTCCRWEVFTYRVTQYMLLVGGGRYPLELVEVCKLGWTLRLLIVFFKKLKLVTSFLKLMLCLALRMFQFRWYSDLLVLPWKCWLREGTEVSGQTLGSIKHVKSIIGGNTIVKQLFVKKDI